MANNNINITVTTNAESAGNAFKSMGASISSSISQANSLDRSFKFLDKALNTGKIDLQQYANLVQTLDREQEELYRSLGNTTTAIKSQGSAASASSAQMSNAAIAAENLTRKQRMAGKSTNRFGMYAQQVGYQVGDFAVQVQSGTNALVAFGQQGTQLAGLLPGIYGAIIGIGLSVSTAVLKSSGALEGLTFDLKRFKEDAASFFSPITPYIRKFAELLGWLGGKAVDAANLIVNAFQYFVTFWRTVPGAIGAGVDWIAGHFRRMVLNIQSATLTAQAYWQKMKDFISGSETMVPVWEIDDNDNVYQTTTSAFEKLKEGAATLAEQADVLGESLERTGGAGKAMGDALRGVEKIDLRNLLDYFSFSDKVAEEAGAAKESLSDLEKQAKSLWESISSSMEKSFMSMVDGTKSVEDSFKDMAKSIISELYKVLVVQKMVGSFDPTGKTASSGILGFLGGFLGKRASGGTVMPNQPYLVGEKGPELIMPQNRGHVMNADLTSKAMSGGESVTVVQNFSFQANGDESVKRIIAQAAPSIANMAKQSVMDARRRGGAMKNTFG